MKIVYICEFFPRNKEHDISGGIEARVYYLTKHLVKNHTITVITSRRKKNEKPYFQNGIQVIPVGLPYAYNRSGAFIGRISFMISSYFAASHLTCDVIEGSSFFSWASAYYAAKKCRSKSVVLIADVVNRYTSEVSLFFSKILKWYEKKSINSQWSGRIYISKAVQKNVCKLYSNKPNSQVIYCGVEPTEFRFRKKHRHKKHIVCVARLVSYKRVDDLLYAVSLLPNKDDFMIDIVGVGDELSHLAQIVRNEKLEKNVTFHGSLNRTKLIRLLQHAWAFCLPSAVEGFGISVIEAACARLPLILPSTEIFKEITLSKGVVFYNLGNSEALADAITTLAASRKKYLLLQKNLKYIVGRYSWNSISNKTASFYESLRNH